MVSNDPSNPADMRTVYISEARCNSHLLQTSKRYRLRFAIQPPATVTGLSSPKSGYVGATHDVVMWRNPFGDGGLTVTPAPLDCRGTIHLLEGRLGRSGRIVASCTLDLSTDEEIRLDLKDDADNKFGELTLYVASSLASLDDAVESANRAAQQLGPGLTGVNDAIQAIAPLTTEITPAWQSLLNRLQALVKVADIVAEVHPWIKLAWGVVSAAYKILSAQSDRDAKVMALVQTMADSCSFADEAEVLKNRSETDQGIINQILRQVMECAYFIRDYCRDKSFVNRVRKYTVSLADARIDNYASILETLRRNLIDHANIQCSVITHRVLDVVTEVRDLQVLSDLKYAPEAHHDLDKACLPGTRTEIIDTIVCWAVGADMPADSSSSLPLNSKESPRVLWLCGTAGAGKSSILRSCAKRISDLGRKGSYYGFDKNKPLANLTNLFSTIARDLADLDNSRKQRLVDAVKNDTAIRTTLDCKLQFQHFITASFKDDKAQGETVVFIDAFDESGDVMARADALAILTKRASEFPPGLRVVVTSRHERDIQDALRPPRPGVDIMLVENIPADQTARDIEMYVRNELHNAYDLGEKHQTPLRDLTRMAGTSFQWAATACRFICWDRKAGMGPQDRIATVLHSNEGLYALYSTVMKEHCDPSSEIAVKRVKSILGRILCAQVPLSLHALVHLVPPDSTLIPDDNGMEIQRGTVKHLASLLSGTHSDHEPIVPLHSSYRDFLCDSEHNKDFYIDKAEANQHMALACFHVMGQTLTFNICQFPTSFLRNTDIPNIENLQKKHIPDHLYYACRFWGLHVSATPSGKFAQKPLESFFRKDFLQWLEVMSVMASSPQTALASVGTSHIATDLVELQQDAMQFISMFATAIMTSLPHIYLSALTFAPASSLLHQRWQGQFPGVAKLAQGQLPHWPNLRLILHGHQSDVSSVAFSPDGKQVASGSLDKTICLWNAETGQSIGWPMKHDDQVLSIAFSPDGKQIASGSRDTSVQLWSVETSLRIGQPMEGHDEAIKTITFSPDAKLIASGSEDQTVQLWSVETGLSIGQPMEGHDEAVLSLAFSPDGKQIASGSEDETIHLWNVQTGVSIGQPMEGHNGFIMCLTFSPDGKQIISVSSNNTIQLWNVDTGASIAHKMGRKSIDQVFAFSPDGRLLASRAWGTPIQLWNVEMGVSIGQLMPGHGASITSIAFSPNGKQIVSGSGASVQLWNVEIGSSLDKWKGGHTAATLSIAFSPDGKLMVSGSKDGTIQLWNAETSASIGQLMKGHDGAVLSLAFSPDRKQIASASSDRTIRLWSVGMGVSIGQPMEGHNGSIWSIAFSPDGKLIASGSLDKTVQLWNVEMGVSIGQPMQGHHGSIQSIAFSPDGKQIASGSKDKTIQLWNVETGRCIGQPMEGHNHAILSIAFSPDGKQIASGSRDKTIRLWSVETGASICRLMEQHNHHTKSSSRDKTTPLQVWDSDPDFRSLLMEQLHAIESSALSPRHDQGIKSITFSPDGKLIASASRAGSIQLWNVETGASIGHPMRCYKSIPSIAFSPDSKQIASGSEYGDLQLWSVERGGSIGDLKGGHNNDISSTDFLPDGKQLTSGSSENTVNIPKLPSTQSKHTLQYPVHLFPLPPSPFQMHDG